MKALSSIICISLGLLFSACTSDDPNKGGFFGGLAGLSKGAYQTRVDNEASELEAEKVRYQGELESKVDLNRSVASRRQRAYYLEQRLTSLREETEALDLEIVALRQAKELTTGSVATAEADVAALLDDIDQIEREQEIQEEADTLGADAGEETDPAAFGEPPREQVSDLRAYINKLQKAVDELKAARDRREVEEARGEDAKPD